MTLVSITRQSGSRGGLLPSRPPKERNWRFARFEHFVRNCMASSRGKKESELNISKRDGSEKRGWTGEMDMRRPSYLITRRMRKREKIGRPCPRQIALQKPASKRANGFELVHKRGEDSGGGDAKRVTAAQKIAQSSGRVGRCTKTSILNLYGEAKSFMCHAESEKGKGKSEKGGGKKGRKALNAVLPQKKEPSLPLKVSVRNLRH